jgi:hypothetical protein
MLYYLDFQKTLTPVQTGQTKEKLLEKAPEAELRWEVEAPRTTEIN